MEFEQSDNNNITFRKPQRSSSLCDLSSNQSLFDATILSLPNTSINESQNNKELYDKINLLQEELLIANQEVINLNLENTTLKRELEKCKHVIDNYKKVCTAEKTIRTPKSKSVKKKCVSRNQTSCNTPPILTPVISEHPLEKPKTAQQTVSQDDPCLVLTCDDQESDPTFRPKRKICLLSNDNKNDVLSMSENTFQGSSLCHYLISHGNTKQLLSGLETKLLNFDRNDFCIIFLGEEDFKRTNAYCEMIFQIREVLQKVQHTNIIICMPTYKYPFDTSLFNCRVETFNNLLYLDILTHKHAYLLDSNLNLEYDCSMFNKNTGKINKLGLRTIFKDLLDLMTDILQNYDIHHNSNDIYTTEDHFFLE